MNDLRKLAEGLDDAWNEATLVLPAGWVLDGCRRLYDEGHASDRWVARAVEPTPDDEQPDGWSMPLIIGTAETPSAALRALAANLRARSSSKVETGVEK